MPNYKRTSTGAGADADFSARVEKEREEAQKAYEAYIKGEGPNPYEKPEGGKQGDMTKGHTTNRKYGGSICGRPTGKGFGKARKR